MKTISLCVALLCVVGSGASAQTTQTPSDNPVARRDAGSRSALRLQVVFSRYQKEKKVSSEPYTLSLIPVGAAGVPSYMSQGQYRMGFQIPVTTTAEGKPATVTYKEVGNSVDCQATARDDSRYTVRCSFEQSSVFNQSEVTPNQRIQTGAAAPIIRSIRSDATLIMADGQTAQHSAGTDPSTGEQVKVDITLNVLK